MPKALIVTEETLDYAVEYARKLGRNLDYLRDNMEYINTEQSEDCYLVTDGTLEANNVTFTDVGASGFLQYWKPIPSTTEFTEIERV